jgi:2-polyprenyl-3-methyl-5-hydroxy-6-metoxy-1,4-benzoquinol methylase
MTERIAHKEEQIRGTENSRRYEEAHREPAKIVFRALQKEIKGLMPSGAYLEVGAGPGNLAAMIAEGNPGVHITAVDISPDMVAVAKSHIEEKNLQDNVHCAVADAKDAVAIESLGQFDLVYSAFSLHHWKDPGGCIGNLWNALKSDGILYIYDLKRVWWLYFLPFTNGFIESVRASYIPDEIERFFQNRGIIHYKITTLFPFFMQSAVAWKQESP